MTSVTREIVGNTYIEAEGDETSDRGRGGLRGGMGRERFRGVSDATGAARRTCEWRDEHSLASTLRLERRS